MNLQFIARRLYFIADNSLVYRNHNTYDRNVHLPCNIKWLSLLMKSIALIQKTDLNWH